MPAPTGENFDRAYELQAETGHHLPYISKSRLTSYQKNPRHYFLRYILDLREPTNYYMWRGKEVHAVIEQYYLNVVAVYESEGGVYSDLTKYLPRDVTSWATWTEPYISNFLLFEYERLEACHAADRMDAFPPVGIEAEVWDWDYPVPLMGFSDVIYHAASLPAVDADEGHVIVDVKTGKTPKKQYRDEGIYLELEYYQRLFGDEYDTVAIAGYYPMKNDFITTASTEERREYVEELLEEMVTLGTDMKDYPCKPGPLSKWGPDRDQESAFYRICGCEGWGKVGGPGPTYEDMNGNPV